MSQIVINAQQDVSVVLTLKHVYFTTKKSSSHQDLMKLFDFYPLYHCVIACIWQITEPDVNIAKTHKNPIYYLK